MKTIKRIKKYYRIKFKLTSPLSVGSGDENFSDKDIVVDGRGYPYIPGTALAGVYRQLFPADIADKYFGLELTADRKKTAMDEGENVLTDSSILVYDAVIQNAEKRVVKTRDMVALDEYKVSKDGAKFDFQILEPGAIFVTYIEQNMECSEDGYILDEIAYAWENKEILLGAKTGRGYGTTEVIELAQCCFDLEKEEECDNWLDFDMYAESKWEPCKKPDCLETLEKDLKKYENGKSEKDCLAYKAALERYNAIEGRRKKDEVVILLELKQCGGISVRQYSTDINGADYSQMTLSDGTPVIPGTTWAGAFRAQMEKLDKNNFGRNKSLTKKFFGDAKEKKRSKVQNVNNDQSNLTEHSVSQKTRIMFSESKFKKDSGRWETYTRNAIDRFSGGTVDGALYTERTYFDGKTELRIVCDYSERNEKYSIKSEVRTTFASVFAAAILDLNEGIMSVGGLTAVGHGLFEIEQITINNGNPKAFRDIDYQTLRDAIAGKESEK